MDNINLDKIIRPEELDHNLILSVPEDIGIKIQKLIQDQATDQEKQELQIEIIQSLNEKMDIDNSRKLMYTYTKFNIYIYILLKLLKINYLIYHLQHLLLISFTLSLKFCESLFPVTILDLPCIIEANKTIDYKNLYKSSDISQMMFVHGEDYKLKNEEDIESFDPFKAKGN